MRLYKQTLAMDVVGVSKRLRRLAEAHVVVYDAVPVRQQRHIQYRTTRAGDAAHPQPRSAPEAVRVDLAAVADDHLLALHLAVHRLHLTDVNVLDRSRRPSSSHITRLTLSISRQPLIRASSEQWW